ncbi:MAG: GTP-binding protein, partial [Pseudomonadota bacterium]|nr:GTP-binding protein [Pseudomonadota bacterium]
TDICILVLNAQDGITKQDKLILNYIKKYNKAFFIVVNKVDTLSTVDLKKLKNDIKYFSNITNNANIFFTSAILGKNISKIPLTIAVLGKLLNKRYKSAKLTKILNDATSKHEPPIYNKKRPKLKFAQQSSLRELVIHIYGNGLKYISPSYKKYLLNYFSTELNLIGLPLEVKFTQKKEPI